MLWRYGRKSIFEGENGNAIRASVTKEGSSGSAAFAELLCTQKQVVLGSVGVVIFEKFLRHRLAHGRNPRVISGARLTQLSPGK